MLSHSTEELSIREMTADVVLYVQSKGASFGTNVRADEDNSTDPVLEFPFSKYALVINILIKKSDIIETGLSDIRPEDVELDVSFLGLYNVGEERNEYLGHVILDNSKCSSNSLFNGASVRLTIPLSSFELPVSFSLVDLIVKKRTQECIDPQIKGDRTLITMPDEKNKCVKNVIILL
eukprot:Nk52_evm22s1916 gene=Nk52_evmTU22s1916